MEIPTGCQELASAATKFFAVIGAKMSADYYGDEQEGKLYLLAPQWSRLMMRGDLVDGKLSKFEFTIHEGYTLKGAYWVKPNCPEAIVDALFADVWEELGLPSTEALTAFVRVQRELGKLL